MKRSASGNRKTAETDITVSVELLSTENSIIQTGVPFFDHMLEALARHGRMRLEVYCSGDTHIDDHHSVEDIGIVLGGALKEALGDKKGIRRFGFGSVPMDDSLTQVSIDLSGRGYFHYNGEVLNGTIKDYDEELTHEFFSALAHHAGMNLHLNLLYGRNRHHIHESFFKSFATALYTAVQFDDVMSGVIPSTKGVI
ncbi:MAG: imidazoleglycerol-phosphate dehydratase HisB [Spirochaetes bacterium]|jgi:imidazoleglycerol-phosphate dehydratase|nr:imidazoleglycerol-phosphate dehydratase HisB [Spirochaetota bacterium]